MDTSAILQIERKSSIDSEPRTLSMNEFQLAREAAIFVWETKSIEEALCIYTKGLEPVLSAVKDKRNFVLDPVEDYDNFASQLRLPTTIPGMKDIASAPF